MADVLSNELENSARLRTLTPNSGTVERYAR